METAILILSSLAAIFAFAAMIQAIWMESRIDNLRLDVDKRWAQLADSVREIQGLLSEASRRNALKNHEPEKNGANINVKQRFLTMAQRRAAASGEIAAGQNDVQRRVAANARAMEG